MTGSNKRNDIGGNLDSDTDEGSHLDAAEDRIVEDASEDSDVTIEDWQNELRTWDVGLPHSNTKRTSAARSDQPNLTKPIPAHVSEDDF